MFTFMKDAVVLCAITLVSGSLLGGVYQVTKEPIAKATAEANRRAYKAVFSQADDFLEDEELIAQLESCQTELATQDFGSVEIENVLQAVDEADQPLGYVITSISNDSYGGAVKLSIGMTEEGVITGVEFLEISDTPGLGLKAKDAKFKDQYIDKTGPVLEVVKRDPTDKQIQAISGATITSSASTNAVNAALYYFDHYISQQEVGQ